MGAALKKETKQFLYTYDLPTIYGRFIDIKAQLKDNESEIKYETALEKLKLLFFELDNLLTEENKKELKEIIGCDNVSCLCLKNNFSAKKIPFCPFSSAKSVLSTIPLRDRSNGLRRS